MDGCEKYTELISAMADGELSQSESDEVRRHMEECESCRTFYDFCVMTSEADMVEPPEELAANIMKLLPKKRKMHIGGYIAVAACAALIIGVAAKLPTFSAKKSDSAAPMEAYDTAEVKLTEDSVPAEAAEESIPMAAPSDGGAALKSASSQGSVCKEYGIDSDDREDDVWSIRQDIEDGRYALVLYFEKIPDTLADFPFDSDGEVTYCEIPKELAVEIMGQAYERSFFSNDSDIAVAIIR